MIVRIFAAFALASALAFTPLSAGAHDGHDHGKKAKKIKKSKGKSAVIEFRLARRAG